MIKKVFMMFVGVALMALPTMAQTFGTQKKEQPNAVFQSTSALQGSGSQYSANPMLNADGTASYNGVSASAPSGPRHAKMEGNIPNPDLGGDGNVEPPIGDAVLPLLLLVLAYAGYKVRVRREGLSQ